MADWEIGEGDLNTTVQLGLLAIDMANTLHGLYRRGAITPTPKWTSADPPILLKGIHDFVHYTGLH